MENEKDREEYVMNDVGRIYTNYSYRAGYRPWNFGQFEKNILGKIQRALIKTNLYTILPIIKTFYKNKGTHRTVRCTIEYYNFRYCSRIASTR